MARRGRVGPQLKWAPATRVCPLGPHLRPPTPRVQEEGGQRSGRAAVNVNGKLDSGGGGRGAGRAEAAGYLAEQVRDRAVLLDRPDRGLMRRSRRLTRAAAPAGSGADGPRAGRWRSTPPSPCPGLPPAARGWRTQAGQPRASRIAARQNRREHQVNGSGAKSPVQGEDVVPSVFTPR